MTTATAPSGANPNVTPMGIVVTAEQIKAAEFLLAGYNKVTSELTELKVVDSRNVPPENDVTRYALIGTGLDRHAGIPLDEFVLEHVPEWDGHMSLNLIFDPHGGGYQRWEPAPSSPPGTAA